MSAVSGFAKGVYYFFVEDGSIVVGAIVALIIVAFLAIVKPFGNADAIAGPLLFVLLAALLVANLLRVAQNAHAGK